MKSGSRRQSGHPPPPDPPGGAGAAEEGFYRPTRQEVWQRVREVRKKLSVRALALEVGVSHGAVSDFERGATPEATWPKWEDWYVKDRAADATPEDADDVASLVMHYAMLPAFAEEWPEAAREIADTIERLCKKHRKPLPAWVAALRESGKKAEALPEPDLRYRKHRTERTSRKKDAGADADHG